MGEKERLGKRVGIETVVKTIQTIETGIETGIETVVKTIQTIETVGRGFDFTPSCTVSMVCMVLQQSLCRSLCWSLSKDR